MVIFICFKFLLIFFVKSIQMYRKRRSAIYKQLIAKYSRYNSVILPAGKNTIKQTPISIMYKTFNSPTNYSL